MIFEGARIAVLCLTVGNKVRDVNTGMINETASIRHFGMWKTKGCRVRKCKQLI